MLGDTEVDLQTAAAAGMLGVAVSWGLEPLMSFWKRAVTYCSRPLGAHRTTELARDNQE